MYDIYGGLIQGAGSIVGSLVSRNTQNDIAKQNYNAQKEFAQNGISWKVADAKQAGIHPLYALGGQTASYSPTYDSGAGTDYGITGASQAIGNSFFGREMRQEQLKQEKAKTKILQSQASEMDKQASSLNISKTMPVPDSTLEASKKLITAKPDVQNEISSGSRKSSLKSLSSSGSNATTTHGFSPALSGVDFGDSIGIVAAKDTQLGNKLEDDGDVISSLSQMALGENEALKWLSKNPNGYIGIKWYGKTPIYTVDVKSPDKIDKAMTSYLKERIRLGDDPLDLIKEYAIKGAVKAVHSMTNYVNPFRKKK